MSCLGCLPNAKERQQEIERVTKIAKDYAISINKMVVIYERSDASISYMEAEAARQNNIQPLQFVSQLQLPVNGQVSGLPL